MAEKNGLERRLAELKAQHLELIAVIEPADTPEETAERMWQRILRYRQEKQALIDASENRAD